jgi:glycopeptide antibiotics resistance protein
MRWLISVFPLFLPIFVGFVVGGVLLARPLARRLGTRASVTFLFVISVGLIVATTLTPHVTAFAGEPLDSKACDIRRTGLIPLEVLLRVNESSLNVLLFIPLGLAVSLLPAGRTRMWLLVGALAMPFLVELIQLSLPMLGRGCQSADIFDNVTGVVIGLAMGLGATAIGRRLRLTTDRGIP